MKAHSAFRRVIAAARKYQRQQKDKALKEAIEIVVLFRDDNWEFIEFYNDDAGL